MSAIKNKWSEYVGPADERQVAEMNKIRQRGFTILTILAVIVLYYINCLSNAVAEKVNELKANGIELAFDPSNLFSIPMLLLAVSVVGVCLYVAIAGARKGISETNRFGNVDSFPWGYYLLWSAGAGIGGGLAFVLLRMAAYYQVFGSILHSAALYLGLAFGFAIPVFALCLIAFYCVFKSAKKHREKFEDELDC